MAYTHKLREHAFAGGSAAPPSDDFYTKTFVASSRVVSTIVCIRRGAFCCLLPLLLLASCSFDYGVATTETSDQPDIIMNEVEYVRVRNGDPIVRFKADTAERYEKKQIMSVREFEFEQFQNHGEEVNVQGSVGAAQIEIDTGNVQMQDGIRIDVISDDISIRTNMLFWEDKTRAISAGKEDEVRIERSDGTSFSGKGFSANAREQIFTFDDGIQGVYFEEDEE
ncbi:MAG: LPS export ABC transporter periplasmic protein LptC [Treponema sp.]|jgi:LPS export ABC transporter protein LptC|nr:LPS export ABC transporter periplasmic protein LptC [Treponema sp.]